MTFIKGDLITIEPRPTEDIISGQQYFSDIIKETNYLGVVTEDLAGSLTRVIWFKHPTREGRLTTVQTKIIKKLVV